METCLWLVTDLELIIFSAKSVAKSEANFQSWDWQFFASEIYSSLASDLPLSSLQPLHSLQTEFLVTSQLALSTLNILTPLGSKAIRFALQGLVFEIEVILEATLII